MTGMQSATIAKTKRILELYDKGTPMEDIASETRSSRHTIRSIAKLHGRYQRRGGRPHNAERVMRIPALRDEHVGWLNDEAQRLGITRGELMRAMLIDAVEEE